MINILLEGYNIDEQWLYEELKNYVRPNHKVAIVAFSFRDSQIKNLEDWEKCYNRENGRFYKGIVGGLLAYGIDEKNVSFLNYFTDTKESAREKIENADIVYFLGGLPDKTMERIKEFELYDVLLNHNGIMMGYSAGALIQLGEYHLSPDGDYPEFVYFKGLPLLNEFYLEVHYEGTDIQNEAIQRVLKERNKTVYATICDEGAILVDNGNLKLLGKVKEYN